MFFVVESQCLKLCTGPAQRQHQHTDYIHGHHTGLHKNCNNTIFLAI